MTIIHKEGAKNKNADGLSRWDLPHTPGNPSYCQIIPAEQRIDKLTCKERERVTAQGKSHATSKQSIRVGSTADLVSPENSACSQIMQEWNNRSPKQKARCCASWKGPTSINREYLVIGVLGRVKQN